MIDVLSVLLSRLTAARAAFLDAAISSRLGSIKSIQTGAVSMTNTTSATATITSVNTAKAIFSLLGQSANWQGAGFLTAIHARVILTNATTVTATKTGAANPGNTLTVRFMIIEFN